jgi:hypothetical protein
LFAVSRINPAHPVIFPLTGVRYETLKIPALTARSCCSGTGGDRCLHRQPPSIPVVYLDAPDTVQCQLFGELPTDPVQAEQVAKNIIQSPGWQQKQQQITKAY